MKTRSKALQKSRENARAFFAPQPKTETEEEWRRMAEDMKKLHSYGAPLKDYKKEVLPDGRQVDVIDGKRYVETTVKGMKRAMGVPMPPADVPDYKKIKALRKTNIEHLVQGLALIEESLKGYGEKKAETRGEIKLLVELAGVRSVMVDKWLVTRTEGSKAREKIDGKKLTRQLLKRGFSADDAAVVIAQATVKGKPGAPSLYVTDTTKARGKRGPD